MRLIIMELSFLCRMFPPCPSPEIVVDNVQIGDLFDVGFAVGRNDVCLEQFPDRGIICGIRNYDPYLHFHSMETGR